MALVPEVRFITAATYHFGNVGGIPARCTIGKERKSNLRIEVDAWDGANQLSRKHAVLNVTETGILLISDQGSTNGTYCDFQRLEERAKHTIIPFRTEVQLARSWLQFAPWTPTPNDHGQPVPTLLVGVIAPELKFFAVALEEALGLRQREQTETLLAGLCTRDDPLYAAEWLDYRSSAVSHAREAVSLISRQGRLYPALGSPYPQYDDVIERLMGELELPQD